MGNRVKLYGVSIITGFFICNALDAQVVLSGSAYVQDFNQLSAGLPPGWSVWEQATATSMGTPSAFETNATSWASTAGEFRNGASITNNAGMADLGASASAQHTFTNRVLAVRQGSSFGDPGAAFALQIADTLGMSNLLYSADFMMLDDESRETVWVIDYALGVPPTNFVVAGLHTNLGPAGTLARPTYPLGPEVNNQPEKLTIRVAALSGSTGSGSRDTFGLDNAQLAFNGSGSGPVTLRCEKTGGELVLAWDDPSFRLQSAPTPQGPFIDVAGAFSPHALGFDSAERYFRLAK